MEGQQGRNALQALESAFPCQHLALKAVGGKRPMVALFAWVGESLANFGACARFRPAGDGHFLGTLVGSFVVHNLRCAGSP